MARMTSGVHWVVERNPTGPRRCPMDDRKQFTYDLRMSTLDERVARRRRTWSGGVARDMAHLASIDRAQWSETTPEERIGLIWSLVTDALALEGHDGPPPRLQRSLGGIRPLRG